MRDILLKFLDKEVDVHLPFTHFTGTLRRWKPESLGDTEFFYLDGHEESIYLNMKMITAVILQNPDEEVKF